MNLINLAETGWIPDSVVRLGIRRLLRRRLEQVASSSAADHAEQRDELAEQLRQAPLAVATAEANRQHYEVPAEFFEQVLGPRLKYSCCYFDGPDTTLADAELAMLSQTCQRAEIADGMRVLELGCGWGSLTLYMAEKFPRCEIVALSNSSSQRRFIEQRAAERGLANLSVLTADMRDVRFDTKFDRVVSVEMFEHMRNYELLFRRISSWLADDGKLFAHVFAHRNSPYLFESEGAANWMGRHFFTGGTMPSEDLFGCFSQDLRIERQWRVNGMHYWRTCEQWLSRLDAARETIAKRFRQDLTRRRARLVVQRWRMFFMACAELFRFEGGKEWFVAHYLFQQARVPSKSRGEAVGRTATST